MVIRRRCTMRFSECVPSSDQSNRFLVIHRHPTECRANVMSSIQRVAIARRSFRIHINQSHLHRAKRFLQVARSMLRSVSLIRQPFLLGTPVDLIVRRVRVGPAKCESESPKTHALQRHVAGQDHQIGPRDVLAVLLLDGPEQAPRLVEVGIVGPRVERREAQGAGAGTAAAIHGAVGAGRMPRHANEEGAVVPVVGRPPVLAVRQHPTQIG
mmetsp:Transcript_25902/g.74897  ORF Transcript_25902/g.74897 Transcript_25902/m.74897 type:complete len:212 (+) Transcript_25902:1498-2133(+)